MYGYVPTDMCVCMCGGVRICMWVYLYYIMINVCMYKGVCNYVCMCIFIYHSDIIILYILTNTSCHLNNLVFLYLYFSTFGAIRISQV